MTTPTITHPLDDPTGRRYWIAGIALHCITLIVGGIAAVVTLGYPSHGTPNLVGTITIGFLVVVIAEARARRALTTRAWWYVPARNRSAGGPRPAVTVTIQGLYTLITVATGWLLLHSNYVDPQYHRVTGGFITGLSLLLLGAEVGRCIVMRRSVEWIMSAPRMVSCALLWVMAYPQGRGTAAYGVGEELAMLLFGMLAVVLLVQWYVRQETARSTE